MLRVKTTVWISTILLLMTYGVYGWIYGSWIVEILEIIEDENRLSQILDTQNSLAILYGIGAIWILAIALIFTVFVDLITINLDSWLKSDIRAFLIIFFGAFAFAIIVQRLDYFARFLILLASAILVKLDLRTMGLNKWLSQLILAIISVGSFFSGLIAFNYWG